MWTQLYTAENPLRFGFSLFRMMVSLINKTLLIYIYIYIIYIYKKQTSVFRFATFQTNSWVQTAHNFTAGTARNLQPERPMVVSRVNFLSDVWWRQPIRSNPVDQLRLVGFFSHDLNTKSTDAELAITKFQAAGSFFESPCFTWTRCLPYRKSRIIWWKNQVSIGFLPKKKHKNCKRNKILHPF